MKHRKLVWAIVFMFLGLACNILPLEDVYGEEGSFVPTGKTTDCDSFTHAFTSVCSNDGQGGASWRMYSADKYYNGETKYRPIYGGSSIMATGDEIGTIANTCKGNNYEYFIIYGWDGRAGSKNTFQFYGPIQWHTWYNPNTKKVEKPSDKIAYNGGYGAFGSLEDYKKRGWEGANIEKDMFKDIYNSLYENRNNIPQFTSYNPAVPLSSFYGSYVCVPKDLNDGDPEYVGQSWGKIDDGEVAESGITSEFTTVNKNIKEKDIKVGDKVKLTFSHNILSSKKILTNAGVNWSVEGRRVTANGKKEGYAFTSTNECPGSFKTLDKFTSQSGDHYYLPPVSDRCNDTDGHVAHDEYEVTFQEEGKYEFCETINKGNKSLSGVCLVINVGEGGGGGDPSDYYGQSWGRIGSGEEVRTGISNSGETKSGETKSIEVGKSLELAFSHNIFSNQEESDVSVSWSVNSPTGGTDSGYTVSSNSTCSSTSPIGSFTEASGAYYLPPQGSNGRNCRDNSEYAIAHNEYKVTFATEGEYNICESVSKDGTKLSEVCFPVEVKGIDGEETSFKITNKVTTFMPQRIVYPGESVQTTVVARSKYEGASSVLSGLVAQEGDMQSIVDAVLLVVGSLKKIETRGYVADCSNTIRSDDDEEGYQDASEGIKNLFKGVSILPLKFDIKEYEVPSTADAGLCYCTQSRIRPHIISYQSSNLLKSIEESDFDWYTSEPDCSVIGKKPTFQVWGGNVTATGKIETSTGTRFGRAYGSWVEHGIIHGGSVTGLASGAAAYNEGSGDEAAKDSKEVDFCNDYSALTISNEGCNSSGIRGGIKINKKDRRDEILERLGITEPGVWTNTGNGKWEKSNRLKAFLGGEIELFDGKAVILSKNIEIDRDAPRSSAQEIPRILIYSEGDINISCGVNRIDAVLIAEGKVDTCGGLTDLGEGVNNVGSFFSGIKETVSGMVEDGDELLGKLKSIGSAIDNLKYKNAEERSNKLVVNGAIIAENIDLGRTYGSSSKEPWTPAEIINNDVTYYLLQDSDSGFSEDGEGLKTVYQAELSPRY